MRRGEKPRIIRDENNNVIAVNLGADFTAEHEIGIAPLREAFGINDKILMRQKYGLGRRQISKVPKFGLRWIEVEGYRGFAYSNVFEIKSPEDIQTRELLPRRGVLGSAWSSTDFGVVAMAAAEEECAALKQIFGAFWTHNVFIALTSGEVFLENRGLTIGIATAIPIDVRTAWEEADRKAAKGKK